MATQLVDSLAGEWDPRQYHDTYTEELRQRIADKQAGKELTVSAEKEPTAKVVDLMEALAANVESAKSSRRSPRRTSRQRRRTAPCGAKKREEVLEGDRLGTGPASPPEAAERTEEGRQAAEHPTGSGASDGDRASDEILSYRPMVRPRRGSSLAPRARVPGPAWHGRRPGAAVAALGQLDRHVRRTPSGRGSGSSSRR